MEGLLVFSEPMHSYTAHQTSVGNSYKIHAAIAPLGTACHSGHYYLKYYRTKRKEKSFRKSEWEKTVIE